MELLTNKSDIKRQILPAADINKPVNVEMKIKLRQIANVVSFTCAEYYNAALVNVVK